MHLCELRQKAMLVFPVVALAESTLEGEVNRFLSILDVGAHPLIRTLIAISAGLVFLYFFWGIVQYIRKNDGTLEEAKKRILWGIIGIFVLVSMWGLVYLLRASILGSRDTPDPDIEFRRNVEFPTAP